MKYRNAQPWKGAAAGLVGGAIGTLVIGAYWKGLNALLGKDLRKQRSEKPGALDDISVAGKVRRAGESATAAVGRVAYETVTDREPEAETKEQLAQTVHWSYGIAQGALYGAVRGQARSPDPIGGALRGAALWGFSELGLPALGLSRGPTSQPPSSHLAQLGAHLTYGLAASAVTQLLREAL